MWRERVAALRNVPPIFRMVWEAAPRIVAASVLLRLLSAMAPLAMLSVARLIIDAVAAVRTGAAPLPQWFWWIVALEFSLATLNAVAGRLLDYCDGLLADKYAVHVSTRIMEHSIRLDLSSYEDPFFYDKLERARVQGTDRLGMIQATGRLVQQAITTVSLGVSLCLFFPPVLAALFLCVVPSFLSETYYAFLGYSLSIQQTPARREMDYLRVLGGSKDSAKEIKLFGLGSFLLGRYRALWDQVHQQNLELAGRKLAVCAALTLVGTAGYYGAYAFAVYETVAGALTLGTLTFLAGAIAATTANLQAFFSTLSSIADHALFLGDLLDFFAVQPKVVSSPSALVAPRPICRGFEFKDVSFCYPGTTSLVLQKVSFRMEPSERIALVGENGQGKTTIVKLLTRLYDVTSGQILLDGVDLRDYNREDLWREIGVIFQDFVRYEMTASANIAVGQITDQANELRIHAAAQKSLAGEVIGKLPKRYEQMLGSRFAGGIDLSGGEWQRMAIARAYLRDAQLLILDEPTASLDARAEREVFERFSELTEGKMSLLISHRFSTVRMADRILVLENGQIAEQGTHPELVLSRGRYAEMFELQASYYR